MTRAAVAALVALGACHADSGPEPIFPPDYLSTYTPVRSCRPSSDHDLHAVLVLADPLALDAYENRDRPFPVGATIVKEERDYADTTCTGPIEQWTVMVRLDDGSSPETLDWHWQKVDANRVVLTDEEPRCYGCHQTCGIPPNGYLGTCEVP